MHDIVIIAEFAERIETRQKELAQLAVKRHARRGFERCNALLFASEKLGCWFEGTTDQRAAIESDLDSIIETQQLMGSRRISLRFKLARREISRFRSMIQKEFGLHDLANGCKRQQHEIKLQRKLQF